MRCLAFALWCFVVSAALAAGLSAADRPPARPRVERINELIARLGSDEFTAREAATEELSKIGLPAYAALEAAASHPDREVRFRSQRVLNLIRQHDQERRLDAFLSGQDDAEEYPLPGWTRFRKKYSDDGQARRLFVEMQRADPELLKAIEDSPRRAMELLIHRMAQTQQAMQSGTQQITVGQVAAELFVCAEEDVPPLPFQSVNSLFSQCFQPTIREIINAGSRGGIPRKMLGTIVARSEDFSAYQAMSVANQFKLREGITPATHALKNYESNRLSIGNMVQYALTTIAQLGDESHLPLVETDKLMHDASQVAQFQEHDTTYVIQLRDVALATAILLSKQDLRAYFDIPPNQSLTEPQMIFLNARLIGFTSDEKRSAVFARWAKYKATQKPQDSSSPAGAAGM
jgi:hypothetical protein